MKQPKVYRQKNLSIMSVIFFYFSGITPLEAFNPKNLKAEDLKILRYFIIHSLYAVVEIDMVY